ncbi:multiprotein-bridging factor 1 family protein [Streptomyces noursei]|uniref:helix-turn-helix domain-containing protein n=1 Tax=Streptomyces noursei TaxID=1971 RepID=UPI003409D8D0
MSVGSALNAALRSAMQAAGLSPRQLAMRVGVSTKTIERWLADVELIPHARNREDAAQALGVDVEMRWPKSVAERVKIGADREIVRSYPYRSACPSTVWADLVGRANDELFFAGYTNYFLWTQQPAFAATLRTKVKAGCRVRFLVGDPEGEAARQREAVEDVALSVSARIRMTLDELEKMGAVEGLEVRTSAAVDAPSHIALSVFRFDDEALVTPHLARLVGHDSPLLHLKRYEPGGMFDRFAEHAEQLWTGATAV